MNLTYHLSDAARKRLFVETGRDPGQSQKLAVDPTQLSPEDRALLVERNPQLYNGVSLTLPAWGSYSGGTYLTLEAIADDPAALLAAYRDARQAAQAAYEEAREAATEQKIAAFRDAAGYSSEARWMLDEASYRDSPRFGELQAAYQALQERIAERERLTAEQRKAEEARKEAEKAQRDAERAAWVATHGSPRLRKCLDGNYNCQRLYVLERAAVEHPAYTVDFDDKAAWKARSGPSEAALDEAARVDGEVVWLTALPVDDGNPDEYQESWFEECEAVVIGRYLGKYDLVKVM